MHKGKIPGLRRMGRWLVNSVPTFPRGGRWLWWLAPRAALALAMICVLAAIPWTYFNTKWGRQLEAELANLRAAGEPLTPLEAAPEPVPESQNAAPLYQKVLGLRFGPDETPPAHPFAEISADDWKTIAAYMEPDKAAGRAAIEPQVRALLNRPDVVETLDVVRRASEMPHCVFPVNWETGFSALYPKLGPLRDAARLTLAQALMRGEAGDTDAALDWSAVALRMSAQVTSYQTMISQLVSIAIQRMTFETLQDILYSAAPSPTAAARLEDCLRELDLKAVHVRALATERALGPHAFNIVRHEVWSVRGLLTQSDISVKDPWAWFLVRTYSTPLGRPLWKGDELTYLKYMGEQMALARLSYREAKRGLEALGQRIQDTPPYLVVAHLLTPVYTRIATRRDEAIARIGLCRVALALKGYRERSRSYPLNLTELQSSVDWRLPEDPFSGKEFIYRRDEQGFLLYSLGRDLNDDQGRPVSKAAKAGEQPSDDGDIVWACQR